MRMRVEEDDRQEGRQLVKENDLRKIIAQVLAEMGPEEKSRTGQTGRTAVRERDRKLSMRKQRAGPDMAGRNRQSRNRRKSR